jgi:hypothetical protein
MGQILQSFIANYIFRWWQSAITLNCICDRTWSKNLALKQLEPAHFDVKRVAPAKRVNLQPSKFSVVSFHLGQEATTKYCKSGRKVNEAKTLRSKNPLRN